MVKMLLFFSLVILESLYNVKIIYIDKKRLQEMLKTLSLENRKTHLPNQLSGGQ